MSGYFGALMRASGLAIAGRPSAVASVEPAVAEIDVERSPAPIAERLVSMPSAQQPTAAPIHVAASLASPDPPIPPANEAHQAAAGFAAIEHADSRATSDAAPAVPSARSVEPAKAPLGEALVRAAMQWVAIDAPQPRSVAQVKAPSQPPPPARGHETSVVASMPARRDHRAESQAQSQDDAPVAVPEPDLSAREPVAPRAVATHSTRMATAPSEIPFVPADRGEVIEVSIGAIHVRVDAPVAQTIARPAATAPAAARRTPATSSQRSALSRRALRRI